MRFWRETGYFLVVVGISLATGCASWSKGSSEKNPSETHYTLDIGKPVLHAKPLPAQTPIHMTSFLDDGTERKRLGYQGWDFNGDSRLDMVQVLGPDGKTQSFVYDFDFDGKVDMTETGEGVRKVMPQGQGESGILNVSRASDHD